MYDTIQNDENFLNLTVKGNSIVLVYDNLFTIILHTVFPRIVSSLESSCHLGAASQHQGRLF
jgi:hypothetical protein